MRQDNLLDETDCAWRSAYWIAAAWVPGQIAGMTHGWVAGGFRTFAALLIIVSLWYAKTAHAISKKLHKEEA